MCGGGRGWAESSSQVTLITLDRGPSCPGERKSGNQCEPPPGPTAALGGGMPPEGKFSQVQSGSWARLRTKASSSYRHPVGSISVCPDRVGAIHPRGTRLLCSQGAPFVGRVHRKLTRSGQGLRAETQIQHGGSGGARVPAFLTTWEVTLPGSGATVSREHCSRVRNQHLRVGSQGSMTFVAPFVPCAQTGIGPRACNSAHGHAHAHRAGILSTGSKRHPRHLTKIVFRK